MSEQILYVDDNVVNRMLVKRVVEAEGHTLLEAADANSGWQTAVSAKPGLILMDLLLPGGDSGLELTRRIKMDAALSHIPVVALTAYGHVEAEADALDAGCVGFLHKPANIKQIQRIVRQFLPKPPLPPLSSVAPTH